MSAIIETVNNSPHKEWIYIFLGTVVIIKYLIDTIKSFATSDMPVPIAKKWSKKWSYLLSMIFGVLSGLVAYFGVQNDHLVFFLGAGLVAGWGSVNFHELGNLIKTWTGVDISFKPFSKR